MADDPEEFLHPRCQPQLIQHEPVLDSIDPKGQGRAHHAFIFSGPKGIGKATAAYALARRIFAAAPEAGLFGDAPVVDTSDPEARLVTAGSHPDMLVLEPEPGKASQTISVDQVRGISQFLSHSPARGDWRMVIVDSLDAVNFNGANAMLKTLEEPPPRSVIVLIHHQSRPVLPTIRSRCRLVRFNRLGFEETRALVLASFPEADAGWIDVASVLADGAPGKARLFAESGAVDLYAETCALLAETAPAPLAMDALSVQWGAGGGTNAAKRQSAKLVFDRLLTLAVRRAAGIAPGQGARLDIEDQAIARITGRLDAETLTGLHQQLISDSDEAERLNLDQAVLYYRLMQRLGQGK